MIISGGKYKGRRIKISKDILFRPSSALLKESLFNVLQSKILNANFLDLYAGSGAIGIEAVSRGADKIVFVENNPKNINIIKKNIETIDSKINYTLINSKVEQAFSNLKNILFDIIFLDPPYNLININYVQELFTLIKNNNILNKEGLIVLEFSEKMNLDHIKVQGIKLIKEKKYGKSRLGFWVFID